MKKQTIALAVLLNLCFHFLHAQNIAINTSGTAATASALLDLNTGNTFTNPNGKGLLIPNLALTATNNASPVTSPATSLLVYNTATAGASPNNVVPGYYYWDGIQWVALGGTGGLDWALLGNAGTVDVTNFLGTTDNIPLNFRVNNLRAGRISSGDNLFLGYLAGKNSSVSVIDNIAIGDSALYTQSFATAFSSNNVAIGNSALFLNDPTLITNGNNNTAVGNWTMRNNTTGTLNTAVGAEALYSNITGGANTAMGYYALRNTNGFQNTAVGRSALEDNSTGFANTAIGSLTLRRNTLGGNNTAIGKESLRENTIGNSNVGIGYRALFFNSTGNANTAIGLQALLFGSGDSNIAIGANALVSGGGTRNTGTGVNVLYANYADNNTAIGYYALQTTAAGSNGVAIGAYSQRYANSTATAWVNSNTSVGYESLRGSLTPAANTGTFNTALGYQALLSNSAGNLNTAIGSGALYSNTIGIGNQAIGYNALYNNIIGNNNTAIGALTLVNNTGTDNTAIGNQALMTNISGSYNTATGLHVLTLNVSGTFNTASGYAALLNNVGGGSNVAYGSYAGYGGTGIDFNQCTFVGSSSYPTTARANVTMLGYGIAEGQLQAGGNQVLLGNTAIVAGGLRSNVNTVTAYSDGRYKTNIKENVNGLDFILKLKPVTYSVRPKELHKIWGTPDSLVRKMDFSEAEKEIRIGFIAQEVEKAAKESGFSFPGLDVPKNDKEVYALRYSDFIMPLVKAVQELNEMNESQQQAINHQLSAIEKLQAENKILSEKYDYLISALLEKGFITKK